MVALVDLLRFSCAQGVLTCCLIERAEEVRVPVALLCVSTDVEAQDCCHEDLEVLSNDALSIIFILIFAFGFFCFAVWLEMVPDGLDGIVF